MNKPQHNPPQHCVCLQIIRGPNERKYDFSSKELFCDGVYGTNSVSCEAFNYMEGLVQNFNVFECPVNSAYTIYVVHPNKHGNIHNAVLSFFKMSQSTPQPDGPKSQWILSMNNQTKTALLHLRPNISVLDISLRNPQLSPQVLLTNEKNRLDTERN